MRSAASTISIRQARLDPSPDDPEELEELVDSARDYAAECAKRNEATLPYLSTDAVAQDLDVIRQALGDEKLTYLGFSYGTLIGSSYAERFPDRIRAMVLDGAIDPTLDLEHLRAGQADGFEKALTAFLDDCAAKTRCAFHEKGKSVAAFDALMASIEAAPLPARWTGIGRQVGPFVASYAVLAALYDRDAWPVLASSLELAKRGDGSLLLQIADPYQGRNPNGSYSNQHDAYTANTCLDFAAPDGCRDVHGLGEGTGGVGAAFRRPDRLQRPGLRVLAGPGAADTRRGHGRRRSTDRGRRHDRRSGNALRVGEGPGRRAGLGGAGHPRRARATRRTSRARASSARSTSTCSG